MSELQIFLGNIWFFLIGLMLVLYVVLDGFDLGVGVLSLFVRAENQRDVMMSSLGSIWDANETWLVLLGGALFGAFPLVYGVALHALYIPIMLMLFGLIFRGVAFEFYVYAQRKQFWGMAFGIGSALAAVSQGLALGAIIQGIEVEAERFSGGVWDWLSPFSLVVGAGVLAGYMLLGATYLIMKTEGEIQQRSYRAAKLTAWSMFAAAAVVTVATPFFHAGVTVRWVSFPMLYYLVALPLLAIATFFMLIRSLRRRYENAPFVWSLAIFLLSFAGLAMTLFPYLLPPSVSIANAAASPKTLVFMLTGIGLLLPVMLIYNGYQYLVFRGKVGQQGYAGHSH
ncbi:MAG: cytochrome d ubiquinol oxidase subunit II [Gammaproteobacteria bacterium]|nr:cytochrome d ubiquinol oxidase subunit II [Gammaproteobacteria bacterium]